MASLYEMFDLLLKGRGDTSISSSFSTAGLSQVALAIVMTSFLNLVLNFALANLTRSKDLNASIS